MTPAGSTHSLQSAAVAAAAAEGTAASAPTSPVRQPLLARVRTQSAPASPHGSRESSRESSRHSGGEAGAALRASAEERAAEAGVLATAGALTLAGVQVAAEWAAPDLDPPATPAAAVGRTTREGDVGAAPGSAAQPSAPFEGIRESWRDLALLAGISVAGSQGLDFVAY